MNEKILLITQYDQGLDNKVIWLGNEGYHVTGTTSSKNLEKEYDIAIMDKEYKEIKAKRKVILTSNNKIFEEAKANGREVHSCPANLLEIIENDFK